MILERSVETNTILNQKFNTYETKAYEYCASKAKPGLVKPLGEFVTRSTFLFLNLRIDIYIDFVIITQKFKDKPRGL